MIIETNKAQSQLETEATSHVDQPAVQPLEEVVDIVKRDSQRDSGEYLEQTIVPFGGE